jgi:hypothetical protein
VSVRNGTANCALGAHPGGPHVSRWLLLTVLLLGAASIHNDRGVASPVASPRSSVQWARLYSALPLSFEANQGQVDGQVKYLARGRAYTLFLTRDEAVLRLRAQKPVDGRELPRIRGRKPQAPDSVLRLRLVGANSNAAVTGGDELPGKANYFLGNDPSKWRTNVPTYARVKYQNIYPGIDLAYYGNQEGQLEYDFVVAPGADPAAITLSLGEHGSPLRIAADGDLLVPLENGELRFHRPVVYQPDNRRSALSGLQRPGFDPGIRTPDSAPRTAIEGRYVLTASNQVRFELGPYDHTRPLVIDPVLYYATYLGGSGGDIGYAIAVDSSFDAYIAGTTSSTNFPTTSTAAHKSSAGSGDAFVTKLNAAGTALMYSTYLGGQDADFAYAIALSAGNAYITGTTYSTDFPTTSPGTSTTPFQQTYGGAGDAFVAELNATGSEIVFSSYLGGNGLDQGLGVAVDSSGSAYVTGYTQSTNFATLNPLYGSINGSQDAFVTKINFTGEQILYSTYLGGTQADVGQTIQVDSSGNMYVSGYTFSSDFPLMNAEQPTAGGGVDAFVTEIASAGSSLVFSTYLGGSNDDSAFGLALDGSGNIYVTGTTYSTDFPTTTGAYQTSNSGGADAFVCKLNAAGSQLVYSTYLGGSDTDRGLAIALSSSGNAYVTGSTQSSNFPTYNAVQSVLGISAGILCGASPCPDAFVTQLNSAGNGVIYSTYLGGSGYDSGQGIAVDSTGDPYITGNTLSTNFPATFTVTSSSTVAPYSASLGGTPGNAFVAKIDSADAPNIALVPNKLNFGSQTLSVRSAVQTVTVINPGTQPLVISSITATGSNSTTEPDFAETDNCVGTLPPGGAYCTINVTFTPSTTSLETSQFTITDNANNVANSTQTITVSGTGTTVATAVTVLPTSLTFANQTVGTVSAPQTVAITNTGTSTLNISSIATSNSDFSQTNTCEAMLNTLSVNQSCIVSVTFSPTASGTRSGSLTIQDNATGSPQSVALSGTGIAAFSLSSSTPTSSVLIGSTSASFTISAASSTGFTGNITLGPACPSNLVCSYSTNPIFAGQSTTLTISNLTTSLANPFNFTITGTSGTQSASVPLTILFQDYRLSATPPLNTITSGTAATYTIIVNPLNGFNQQVSLSCESTGFPPDATCTFSNSTPTPNGGPANVTLTINTVKYVENTQTPPRYPAGKIPPLILGVLGLLGLASLALTSRRRARHGSLGGAWLGVRLVTLCLILMLDLALGSCRPAATAGGTTTGNYTIIIDGTLVSNTAVVRKTTFNLAVT